MAMRRQLIAICRFDNIDKFTITISPNKVPNIVRRIITIYPSILGLPIIFVTYI